MYSDVCRGGLSFCAVFMFSQPNVFKMLEMMQQMLKITKTTNIDSDTLISQLKNKLLECKVKAKNTMDNIMSVVEGKECDKSFLKALLLLYNHEMEQVSSVSEQIDMEYEKELRILTEKKTDTLLSSSDIAILAQE